MAVKEAVDAINEMNSSLETFIESLTADISFVEDETSRDALQAVIRQANNWKKFNIELLKML